MGGRDGPGKPDSIATIEMLKEKEPGVGQVGSGNVNSYKEWRR